MGRSSPLTEGGQPSDEPDRSGVVLSWANRHQTELAYIRNHASWLNRE